MYHKHAVVWTENTIIEPQHFQQFERSLQRHYRACLEQLMPLAWGIAELKIDQNSLANGKLIVDRASGIFADGTGFDAPDDSILPKPLDVEVGMIGEIVYLVIPVEKNGAALYDYEAAKARYDIISLNIDNSVKSPDGVRERADIDVAVLNLNLRLGRQVSSSDVAIAIARIGDVTQAGNVHLDPSFVPTATNAWLSDSLRNFVREILGKIALRLETLSNANIAGNIRVGSLSDMAEMMLLQVFSEYFRVLSHMLAISPTHPILLHRELARLVGRLNFIPGVTMELQEDAFEYDHNNLQHSFSALMTHIRRALAIVVEAPAIPIPVKRRDDGIFLCDLNPQWRVEKLVIIASASIPNAQLAENLPKQSKISTPNKILKLIDSHLAGAPLNALATAPRHVPYYSTGVYFEVEVSNDTWKEIVNSNELAISIVGNFPGFEFEIWGLREGRIG